jgi:uncharacterized protein YfaS (alpha-2-macroglobulin family)
MDHSQEKSDKDYNKKGSGWWLWGLLLLILAAGFILLSKTEGKDKTPVIPDPAFAAYVSGYTGGAVSRDHPIFIRLALAPVNDVMAGDPLKKGLLTFYPSIEGKAFWKDKRTIEFLPAEQMKSGAVYRAVLQLNKIVKVKSKKFNEFVFGFQVIHQSFEVVPMQLIAKAEGETGEFTYKGMIITADAAGDKNIEKMLTATFNGEKIPVSWKHESPTKHIFLVNHLKQGKQSRQLKLSWSGDAIGLSESGSKEITVPEAVSFQLLNVTVEQGKQQRLHLFFSGPLNEDQDFKGLIKIDTQQDLSYEVKDNELTVFLNSRLIGLKNVSVFQGIQNNRQKIITADTAFQVTFESPEPALRFVHKGNLLPSANGMTLPFEAVGLKSVVVRVIKIHQDRIGQFLQVNDIDGSSQLNRVGRPIFKKVIYLKNMGPYDPDNWNRFTLELSKLIKPEPGAIYQVALAFTPIDLAKGCGMETREGDLTKVADPREKIDETNFDNGDGDYFSDGFGDYYGDDYDWEKRNDPCNPAYYSGEKNVIKENILATDIGLLAKRGTDNKLLVIATDLLTASPMPHVAIHVYNFQLQEIATTSTNNTGEAWVNLDQKAFLIEAENGKQWSYLKVNGGAARSVSQFNVSGQKVQQGIKGFLYGDRGVWRPGDSLYLAFMLEDKNQKLPEHHPVIFELANPMGTVVQRTVKSSSVNGLYAFKTATPADAPTGNWTATVKVGGATFIKNIPVETVKPNRLKIDLSFPADKITADQQNGSLHARWLSGATAANLKAKYDLVLQAIPTKIKGYAHYDFDDPLSEFETENRTVFEGSLDARGNATINPGIHLSKPSPATLKAYFTGKVFEPGGNFSVSYQSVNFYPYQTYIGMKLPQGSGFGDMLDADKDYQVKIVSVDSSGKPVNRKDLKVTVYKTQWHWWWEADENDEADFINSKYYNKTFETKLTTENGKGSFTLRVPSSDWGRYYIRVQDLNSDYTTGAFVYFRWPYFSGSNVAGMPGGATHLTFTTDKQVYKTGENMKLFIPGSGAGNILISVENGSGVLKTYWLEEKKGTNTFSIPVTKEMTPNIYLDVTEIQPHGQTINDLPIRQYGIVGVTIKDPETILHPVISMPKELKPNGKVTIRVQEQNGRPMAYTVALVDEGLLDLTNFKTPDPHNAFYAKEALGVKTWDVYDRVIGAYGGALERLFSIGGGNAESEKPASHNLRFKPVVQFFGPYFLKKGATQTHSFTMPEYVGEVRTMVIAGYEGAYGSTEKSVPVRQPLMVLATLPRVAGPGEDIMLPVNVFAMKPGVKNVSVQVSSNRYFEIKEATKKIHFDEPGNTMVMFRVHVNNAIGAGKITVVASGDGYSAKTETNLTVRNPNPPETKVLSKNMGPGETWSPDIKFFGVKGTNTAGLEISGLPPLNLGRRLGYLTNYPFGCLEQKVSGAFPQLFLADITALPKAQKEEMAKNVTNIIEEIPAFQCGNGGFAYWKGENDPNDWVSSYAGSFLLMAMEKGYQVMPDVLKKWRQYQTGAANAWSPNRKYYEDDLVQAYRLYTLALAKYPDWSAMNRMHGLQNISVPARWRLAAAYTIAGRKDVANQLVQQISTDVPEYHNPGITLGSRLRDEAMILQTLTEMGDSKRGFALAQIITKALNSDSWLNTQETAFSLMALSQFYSHEKRASKVSYSFRENKDGMKTVQSEKLVSRQVLSLTPNASKLSITNNSDGNLFADVFIKGIPAAGKEVASSHNLNMTIRYKDRNGKAIDPAGLRQGMDFVAEVTVRNPGSRGDYENMALTQVFPSGWEIRNARMSGTPDLPGASIPDYQDIRDDRVYTFFDLAAGKSKTFRILLNASYAGRFYLPGITCSAMYDHSINASKAGKWVKVEKE